MTFLPSEPAMLQSYLNTLLRDRDEGLSALAEDLDLEIDVLEKKLQDAGLRYDEATNTLR